MPVEYLRIVTESRRSVTLKLPEQSTMLTVMRGGTKNVAHISGDSPSLMGGNVNYGTATILGASTAADVTRCNSVSVDGPPRTGAAGMEMTPTANAHPRAALVWGS